MLQPLENERRYVAVSAKGCRKLREDVELACWEMASVAAARSQIEKSCIAIAAKVNRVMAM